MDMEILIVCPANCATGGPEALHGLASDLNQMGRVHARLWYWDVAGSDPTPSEYKSYNCEYVTELPAGYDGVLIVPEIWANDVMNYPQCTRAVWWLGVDAYAGWTPAAERGAFLRDKDIVHITQSEYAADFLYKLGVEKIVSCTDIVNADFYAEYEEHERSDVVLYNPAKATTFTQKIMEACPDIIFKPITGMTRAEVIETMRSSKLYIDFGRFPGRERMPREAALCGCCLITSKTGSADYWGDFAHTYKFDSKDSHIWAITHKIRYVISNYEKCRQDFEELKWQLLGDQRAVKEEHKKLIEEFYEIQHHHSGT